MDPRLLRKKLEGWWCADQMTIEEIIADIEREEETGD